jgi:hypothetical protein
MKKTILILIVSLSIFKNLLAEDFPSYCTYIAFNTNSTKISNGINRSKASLTYFDCRAIFLPEKYYGEFGFPIAGYFLTSAIRGKSITKFASSVGANGEVGYIYLKGGYDIIQGDGLHIGLGATYDNRKLYFDGSSGIQTDALWWNFSPIIYAKLALNQILIAPILNIDLYSGTDIGNSEIIKRRGFGLETHVIFPIGDLIGLHFTPVIEVGKFKSPIPLKTTNLALRMGVSFHMN